MKKHVIKLIIFSFCSCVSIWGKTTLIEGYNKSNGVNLKTNWSFHLNTSFIYWYVSQEGLNIGVTNPNNSFIESRVLKMDFDYEPGFILAAKIKNNPSGFDIYFAYSRLHFSNSQFQESSSFPLWLHEDNTAIASESDASWNFKLDFLDIEFARSYYVGTKLNFRTYVGLRGNVLDQNFLIDYTINSMSIFSKNTSDSWAIGPRMGLDTKWCLTERFKTIFTVATSILYTNYKVSHRENSTTNFLELAFSYNNQVIKVLRPSFEMGAGLGWGINFYKNRCHFSLSAKYDFQVMFDQNIMRSILSATALDTTALSNLYLHGLTLKAGFDF